MPHNVAVRGISIGPFEAIQRMFVLGHLPLPPGLVESFKAPFCRSNHRGLLRVGQRGINAAGEGADVIAHRRVTPWATTAVTARMTAYSVIDWGTPRDAHVPSETPS